MGKYQMLALAQKETRTDQPLHIAGDLLRITRRHQPVQQRFFAAPANVSDSAHHFPLQR